MPSLQEARVVADPVLADRELVEALGVHEVIVVAGRVKVLGIVRLEPHVDDLLAGVPRLVDDLAGLEALELRADERAALARLDVLELDDAEEVVLVLDDEAVLDVCGGGHWNSGWGS
jgi:putative heme degradation protein